MKVQRVDALMKLLLLPRVTSLPCIVILLTQPIIERCNYTESIISNQPRFSGASWNVKFPYPAATSHPILEPKLTLPLALSRPSRRRQTFHHRAIKENKSMSRLPHLSLAKLCRGHVSLNYPLVQFIGLYVKIFGWKINSKIFIIICCYNEKENNKKKYTKKKFVKSNQYCFQRSCKRF